MPKFVTSQNIEIDLQLASLGERIVAYIIDAVIIIVFIILCSIAITWAQAPDELFYVVAILFMFHTLFFETFFHGQTIGKKAMSIRVVKMDGTPAGLGNYLLRWILRLVDIYLMSGGVAVISIIASQNGQRLGDLAAGTIVIKMQPVVTNADLVFKFNENHVVTYPGVKVLNDRQIEIIRIALDMKKEALNADAVRLTAEKIKELMSVESDMPDVKFLYTVIADYEYLAGKEG